MGAAGTRRPESDTFGWPALGHFRVTALGAGPGENLQTRLTVLGRQQYIRL